MLRLKMENERCKKCLNVRTHKEKREKKEGGKQDIELE